MTMHEGLPPLGGRLLAAYRIVWAGLAIAALAALCLAVLEPQGHPVISTLRLGKGALIIAIAVTLLRRRPRDPVAALLALAFLCWTVSSSVDFSASGAVAAMLLDRLRFLLFVLALLLFPDGTWAPAWTRRVALASAAVFLIGVVETLNVVPTRIFLPLAIACVVAAVASLIARFRAAASERLRQQLRWVALGLVAGIGLILGARAGAAVAANLAIAWEAMFQLGILIVALGFLVSLLRYRLYDADTAISRSAAYAALTVTMVATFAGTEAAIQWFGQRYLGMGIGDVSAAMAAAVAALLLSPVHSRVSRWAEERFQRDLVTLKRDLPDLVADLSATASAGQLGAAALSRINEAVHATRAALIAGRTVVAAHGLTARQADQWYRDVKAGLRPLASSDPTDPTFPVRVAIGCAFCSQSAWVVLGPRPDGSLFGSDELDALAAVGPAIRHALATAAAREATQTNARRAAARIRRLIMEVRERVELIEDHLLVSQAGMSN